MFRRAVAAVLDGWRAQSAAMRPTAYMRAVLAASPPRGPWWFEARQAVLGYLSGCWRGTDTSFQKDQFTVDEKARTVASLPTDLGPVVLVRPSLSMLADMRGGPHLWTPEGTA